LNPALEGKRHAFFAAREPNAFKPDDWQTIANQDGQGYILNGKKILSAMPSAQDFFVVLAKDTAGISAFMVEPNQSGVTISKNGSITLSLNQCRTESILGESGHALQLGAETTPAAGIRLGARYVGLASRLLDMSAEYARTWTALGALLKERPAIQRILAEVKVQIESTRWLVYHAAWVADKQGATRELAAEIRLVSGEMLSKATNLITMVYGGPGPSPEVEIHRYVHSTIPMEALEFGLISARLVIANELTAVSAGG
jgi:alkylation response protein AidB-like acyl-CoA dehydrogenase